MSAAPRDTPALRNPTSLPLSTGAQPDATVAPPLEPGWEAEPSSSSRAFAQRAEQVALIKDVTIIDSVRPVWLLLLWWLAAG